MLKILEKSAVEQSCLIRDGEITSLQLTELYIEQIAKHNPLLNAVIADFGKAARREAIRRDRWQKRHQDQQLDPLWGVPSVVKDVDFVRRSFTRFGSRSLRWLWSPIDGPAAKNMRRAGMVILGKTAASEMGIMPITETDLHGATRNPWDPERSCGGSSGGSGAAVAARMVPLAHGSDGAGSIRIPAALNGIFGYKASRGFLVNPYAAQDVFALATIGPLARFVEDLAAMADLWRVDHSQPPLLQTLANKLDSLSVSVVRESPLGALPDEFVGAVDKVAEAIRELGHKTGTAPPVPGSIQEFLPIYQKQFSKTPVFSKKRLQPVTRWLLEAGKKLDLAEVQQTAELLRQRALASWGNADFWLTPAVGMPAPKIGEFAGLAAPEQFNQVAPLGAFTAVFNLTGQPAAALPVGFDKSGMPVAVQLVGQVGDDARLLSLTRQISDIMQLKALRPPERTDQPG